MMTKTLLLRNFLKSFQRNQFHNSNFISRECNFFGYEKLLFRYHRVRLLRVYWPQSMISVIFWLWLSTSTRIVRLKLQPRRQFIIRTKKLLARRAVSKRTSRQTVRSIIGRANLIQFLSHWFPLQPTMTRRLLPPWKFDCCCNNLFYGF